MLHEYLPQIFSYPQIQVVEKKQWGNESQQNQ